MRIFDDLRHCVAIEAVIAVRGRRRHRFAIQAFFAIHQGALHPGVGTGVWNQINVEFQLAVERLPVGLSIAIYEIARVRHGKARTSQKPLVHFHLALVASLPFSIKRDLCFLACGFIIYNDDLVFALRTRLFAYPKIVDCACHDEVGGRMMTLDPLKVLTPLVQFAVRERNRIDAVGFHEWMSRFFGAVNVELLFQERVHCGVECERKTGRTSHTEPAVQVKTARTIQKKLYFRARQAERLPIRRGIFLRIIQITASVGIIVFGHNAILTHGTKICMEN